MSELRELLDKVAEKLYAGFFIYAAIAYLVWLPLLSGFLLVWELPLIRSLPGWLEGIIAMLYWLGVALVVARLVMKHYWRRYIERLAARASLEARKRCKKFLALWAAAPVVIVLSSMVFTPVYGEAAVAVSVAVGLAIGNLGNALMDRCYGVKRPPPLIAVVVLLASTPLIAVGVWGPLIAAIMASYSMVAIAYLSMALTRLG